MTTSIVISDYNDLFAIPGVACVVAGQGGLPAVRITSPAASAEIYLHGGHVTSWQPMGSEDVIFLSERSRCESAKAIRGGIPICFPWFGAKSDDAKAPQHGFARTSEWRLASIARGGTRDGDPVVVTLVLEDSEATRALWPHAFRAEYRVAVGDELTLALSITNTGDVDFQFEEALHTYFAVENVKRIRVEGLDGAAYLDKPDGFREKRQKGDIAFATLTDRVYLDVPCAVTIADAARRIAVAKENSNNTVVWNPWSDGAKALSDMGDEEWRKFVCVEAVNCLGAAVTLAPGQEHTMSATVRVS